MDINRFTEKAQEALNEAQTKAVRCGHQQVDIEHVLAALLDQDRGLAAAILNKAGIPTAGLKAQLDQLLQRMPRVSSPSGAAGQIYITGRLNQLMVQGEDEAKQFKDEYISVEHL